MFAKDFLKHQILIFKKLFYSEKKKQIKHGVPIQSFILINQVNLEVAVLLLYGSAEYIFQTHLQTEIASYREYENPYNYF